jgi:hypothetical protein
VVKPCALPAVRLLLPAVSNSSASNNTPTTTNSSSSSSFRVAIQAQLQTLSAPTHCCIASCCLLLPQQHMLLLLPTQHMLLLLTAAAQ